MPVRDALVMPPIILLLGIALAGCGAGPAKPPAAPPPVRVEVATATAGPVDEVVEALGTVGAIDAVNLSVKSTGIVRTLAIEDGGKVERGALLVELDRGEAEGELRQAQTVRDNLARTLKVKQPLLESKAIALNDLDDLRAQLAAAEAQVLTAQARLDDRRVVAPFAGRLGLRQVSVGALISPGTVVASLASISPVKLVFMVPETRLALLKPGLTVRATAPTFAGRVFTGTVSAIDAAIDPATRAIAVQALIPNQDEALRPGLSMQVELVLGVVADAVTVPEQGVLLQGDHATAFAIAQVDGHAVLKRQEVRLGRRENGRVRIVEGLAAGTEVVVQGPLMMRDGTAVQIIDPAPAPVPASASTPAPVPAAGGR
jgi:membrane fusion protein (multidrug efflux system)